MKRIYLLVAGVLVLLLLAGFSVFAEDSIKVKGTVTKIDIPAKTVTIQPKEGKPVTVVMEDADPLSKVKEGEKGQATYVVKDGMNAGLKLKKLSEGCQ